METSVTILEERLESLKAYVESADRSIASHVSETERLTKYKHEYLAVIADVQVSLSILRKV